MMTDAQAHGRWHPLGDGYQPQPGDWVLFEHHVEVVTSYSGGVLDSIGADSAPEPLGQRPLHTGSLAAAGRGRLHRQRQPRAAGVGGARRHRAGDTRRGSAAADESHVAARRRRRRASAPAAPAASGTAGAAAGDRGQAASTPAAERRRRAAASGTSPPVRRRAAARRRAGHARRPTASAAATAGAASRARASSRRRRARPAPAYRGTPPGSAPVARPTWTTPAANTGGSAVAVPRHGLAGCGRARGEPGRDAPAAHPTAPPATAAGCHRRRQPDAAPPTPAATATASPTATQRPPRLPPRARRRESRRSPEQYRQYAAPAQATPGTRSQQAFISLVAPGAEAAQQRWGVPAAVTIAQAIDESAWGKSQLAADYHNLFGIKGAGPAGSVELPTSEFYNGQWVTIDAPFRVYHNVAESIADHAELLATSGYYQRAMADRAVPDAFANDLTGVYATDPDYGANLIAIMKLYNLYRFDEPGAPRPRRRRRRRPPAPTAAPSRPAAPARRPGQPARQPPRRPGSDRPARRRSRPATPGARPDAAGDRGAGAPAAGGHSGSRRRPSRPPSATAGAARTAAHERGRAERGGRNVARQDGPASTRHRLARRAASASIPGLPAPPPPPPARPPPPPAPTATAGSRHRRATATAAVNYQRQPAGARRRPPGTSRSSPRA